MDEEYVKQVCRLMAWNPVKLEVLQPALNRAICKQANNASYWLLSFPTPTHTASALAQISAGSHNPLIMT